MEEKILTTKKNGMAVLLLTSLLYLAAVAVCVLSSVSMSNDITPLNITGLVLSIIWLACRTESIKATGSTCPHSFWKVYRLSERFRILFCKSILYRSQSCCKDKIKPER